MAVTVSNMLGWRRLEDIPSGKRLHNELENHHAINGKTHYFYGHGFHSYVTNYQRVTNEFYHG